MALSPTERRAALDAAGWSQRELARHLGRNDGTVRGWMRGTGEAPPEVDAWLAEFHAFYTLPAQAAWAERVAKFHRDHPPPSKPEPEPAQGQYRHPRGSEWCDPAIQVVGSGADYASACWCGHGINNGVGQCPECQEDNGRNG